MARILVVDDEPDALLVMRIHLDRAGHETVLAADGEQALERLDGVDLVLLDIRMPVMDGWGVLEAVRARVGGPRVVVVSGRPSPGDLRRALELGAAEYVAKPFLPHQLLEVVDRVLTPGADAGASGRPGTDPE